jgi:hypothetical protein
MLRGITRSSQRIALMTKVGETTTERAYLRTVHFKARIDLMQRWADHCEGVTPGRSTSSMANPLPVRPASANVAAA